MRIYIDYTDLIQRIRLDLGLDIYLDFYIDLLDLDLDYDSMMNECEWNLTLNFNFKL